jgi:hypothetical protein
VTGAPTGRISLVDAHVHLHRTFDIPAFLEHASRNFEQAASDIGRLHAGVLLLAESPGEGAFERLRTLRTKSWAAVETDETESIVLRGYFAAPLVVVAGQQLVTRERVELLALLTGRRFPGGLPLADTIQFVRQEDAIAVLPWGFGKWTRERAKAVAGVITKTDGIFVGDNGGRWDLLPEPEIFALARSRSIPILPGSDPLPFADHSGRAGSFGFVVPRNIDLEHPARDLRSWLRSHREQPQTFGRLETGGTFAWNQLRMQWRKRVRTT